MSKKIHMIAVILVLLFAFSGCSGKEPTIMGEWYSEKDDMLLIVNEDSTFRMLDESVHDGESVDDHEDVHDHDLLAGTYRIEGDKFLFKPTHEAELTNTYKLEGNKLILTYGEYSMTLKRVEK